MRRGLGEALAPAAARVLLVGPAGLGGLGLGLLLRQERAHGLGGVLEGGVVGVDHGLGHDVCGGAHDVAAAHLVEDGLGKLVSDVALAHGARLGEGHLGGLAVVGGGVGEGVVDHADLGAVAVGDDHVDALGHHVDDVAGGVLHQLELLLGRVAQGVAAERDDDGLTGTFLIRHVYSFSMPLGNPCTVRRLPA